MLLATWQLPLLKDSYESDTGQTLLTLSRLILPTLEGELLWPSDRWETEIHHTDHIYWVFAMFYLSTLYLWPHLILITILWCKCNFTSILQMRKLRLKEFTLLAHNKTSGSRSLYSSGSLLISCYTDSQKGRERGRQPTPNANEFSTQRWWMR